MRNKFFSVVAVVAVATSAIVVNTPATWAANRTMAVPTPTATNVVAPNANAFVAPSMGTSLSTTTKAVFGKKSKYSASYVAESEVDAQAANHNNYDGFYSNQHLGLGYDLGDAKKIQYRQYFHYNMTDRTRTDEWGLGDHVFQYTDASAVKIADADMVFNARLYMPGAEWTRTVGKYELRLSESVTQKLSSKANLDYSLETRFYAFSGNNDGQLGFRMLPAVEINYKANKYLTPYAMAYTAHSWAHSGSGPTLYMKSGEVTNPQNYSEKFLTDLGAVVAVNKNVSLNLYVETAKNLKSNENYEPFHQDFSTYDLVLSVSM